MAEPPPQDPPLKYELRQTDVRLRREEQAATPPQFPPRRKRPRPDNRKRRHLGRHFVPPSGRSRHFGAELRVSLHDCVSCGRRCLLRGGVPVVRLGVLETPKPLPKTSPGPLPAPRADPKLSLYAHVRLGGGAPKLGEGEDGGSPPRLRLVVTQGGLALALPPLAEH